MSNTPKKHRYKRVAGKRLIEVRIKSPRQLFDARDPAPFHERDLDDDFVEYIMSSALELPRIAPVKIVIYIEEKESSDLTQASIKEAIHSFLAYQIDLQRSSLKNFLKRAQLFGVIGIGVLATCLIIAQKIQSSSGMLEVLHEGLLIFGWVSMWKPIELVLFDWYPLYEKLRLLKKLWATDIDIQFSSNINPS